MIVFPEPWEQVAADNNLLAVLQTELGPGHILYGKDLVAIARRGDNDDVLFELKGGEFRYAIVHLTWAGRPEPDPRWPGTRLSNDLSAAFLD
jgi:hypothetical protein